MMPCRQFYQLAGRIPAGEWVFGGAIVLGINGQRIADALLWLGIGFCIAMFTGDALDWGPIRVQWETLFAGLAAVGAAYLTVSQMRRSDALSEERYRLMRLQDVTTKRNMIASAKEMITHNSNFLFRELRKCATASPSEDETLDSFKKRISHCRALAKNAAKVLNSPQVTNAATLISARGQLAIIEAREDIDRLIRAADIGMDACIRFKEVGDARDMDRTCMDSARWLADNFQNVVIAVYDAHNLFANEPIS